ncbi:efflux RND transporter permease subunit [Gryllotalpicola sp.]|uniref:efflux RND transporter permease subunit n=1 Tax=Gryllotalpicola sp. TaxID=1932787 RepID=UPI00263196B0|nr:efflux RND transporter permease subunit [Gryllotalpicola sp.]
MHRLAVLSMKNRALIALITICVGAFGFVSLSNLKQELIPSISLPELVVMTQYPGASPEVVNNDVSSPIEQALQSIPNLDSTTAVSSTNLSLITATFTYGSDMTTAAQKVERAISQISSRLPAAVSPQVVTASLDDLPVLRIAATGPVSEAVLGGDLARLTVPEINKVAGVNDAQIVGLSGQRVSITPDKARLAAHGLTAQAISQALSANGILLPGGSITSGDQTLSVQSGAKLTSVDQLKALPLIAAQTATATGGTAIPGSAKAPTVGDVATVKLDTDPTTSLSRVNGKPALTIGITKLPSANTVDVSNGVKALLPKLQAELPAGTQLTVVFDQAPFITQSISSLAEEGALGLGFAIIVILLFLLSIRATIVTAISIPTSVLITFIAMWLSGYTLNIITLAGLTIAIGRVVDDSIVVIENIKRHLDRAGRSGAGDRAAIVVAAVREVAGAITASTITTVAVFLPLAFVGNQTGELFRPFAVTVAIALVASLFVALTIVPVLAYWFLRARSSAAAGPAPESEDDLARPTWLQRGYLPILRWTLRHSMPTLLIAVLVLGGTVFSARFLTTNFLGSSGQNTLSVSQTLPAGTSLSAKDAAAKKVEEAVLGTPGVTIVQSSIGASGSALADAFLGGGGSTTFSITTDPSYDQTALEADIESRLKTVTGAGDIAVSAQSGFGSSNSVEIDVTAPDEKTLQQASDAVVAKLTTFSAVKQVASNLSSTLPYIAVDVDRATAAQYGLTEVALGQIVSQAMQPTQIGTIAINSSTLKIYLDNSSAPTTVAQLKALQIPTPVGYLPLSRLADVHEAQGPATVSTTHALRSAKITAVPVGADLTGANAAVSATIKDAVLPAGATAKVGGVGSDQASAFQQLGLALLAAILIVYIVMVATFRSLRQPLLLLVSVPFAATGAILLQLATGIPLGVASLVGVLMLIGIVVTNAIVLVDLVNQYRARGLAVPDALVHGAARRLRPILMTALATIFALLPMALGLTGHGSFISQPLALVVIGGLVSSTVLTLIVLPTLYNLVEGAQDRRAAKRAARAVVSGG